MNETFGPSTMLPDWVSWAVALFGILLILWPYLFRRKPKGRAVQVPWEVDGKTAGSGTVIILDSWEPKWPEGQSKEKP